MVECTNKHRNAQQCNCTYPGCERHGVCCECIRYHRISSELPACYFDKEQEKTYDRSMEFYLHRKEM